MHYFDRQRWKVSFRAGGQLNTKEKVLWTYYNPALTHSLHRIILGLFGTFCTLQTKLVDHATSNKLGLRRVATVTASVLWILMLCRYGSLSNTFTKFKCGRSSVSFLWRIYGCYFLLVQVRWLSRQRRSVANNICRQYYFLVYSTWFTFSLSGIENTTSSRHAGYQSILKVRLWSFSCVIPWHLVEV